MNTDLSFIIKYDAFSKEIERLFKIQMPILTKNLRKIRVDIVHRGYNPKKEETDAIASFTIGFLKKLENLTLN